MKTLTLQRTYYDERTLGDLITEEGEVLIKTMELPWLDNESEKSCIPEKIGYLAQWQFSLHLGWIYRLSGTDPRTCIDIHKGNFTSQILGCIETGDKYGELNGEFAILDSGSALQKLYDYAGEEFQLNIVS